MNGNLLYRNLQPSACRIITSPPRLDSAPGHLAMAGSIGNRSLQTAVDSPLTPLQRPINGPLRLARHPRIASKETRPVRPDAAACSQQAGGKKAGKGRSVDSSSTNGTRAKQDNAKRAAAVGAKAARPGKASPARQATPGPASHPRPGKAPPARQGTPGPARHPRPPEPSTSFFLCTFLAPKNHKGFKC